MERLASWGYAVFTVRSRRKRALWLPPARPVARFGGGCPLTSSLLTCPCCLQYDRPLGGTVQPAAETEVAYFDSIMAWRNSANNTRGGRLAGQFAAGPAGVIGHSMGGGEGRM